ncbi:integration host factor subunit alpha [Minwuia sp.]|uniref:integration host factor subunit alpha n=1 Tax=Minwuia sp. TaxID=2493630 RepID=UPI003A95382C
MSGKTISRAQLSEAIAMRVGLSRQASRQLLDMLIDEIADALVAGHDVKIHTFGNFSVREKSLRIGRNPKTGAPVAIEPRRVLAFKASGKLKDRVR